MHTTISHRYGCLSLLLILSMLAMVTGNDHNSYASSTLIHHDALNSSNVEVADCGSPANCPLRMSCGECVTDINCGWCPTLSRCVPVDTQGDICPPGTCAECMKWKRCDTCATLYGASCDNCVKDDRCAWCTSSNQCLDRRTSGSLCNNGACNNRTGCLRLTTCSSSLCESQMDCESCTSTLYGQCAWLSPRGACVPRDESGSSVCGRDQMNNECVRYSRYTCAPTPSCATHSDCTSCIQASDYCGWCSSSNTCMEVNDDGTTCRQGTCNGCIFRKNVDYCPANFAPTCDGQDCRTCLSSRGCGWCSTTGQCFAAKEGQICDASINSCPGCVYSHLQADAYCPAVSGKLCNDYHDCQSCTEASRRGCAWCTSSLTCVSTYSSASSGITACSNQTCTGCFRDPDTASSWCAINHGHCSDYTTCLSCATEGSPRGCGWCTRTNKCIDVRKVDYGACDATSCTNSCVRSFVSAPYYCPTTALSCSEYSTCKSCTEASQRGCGWCSKSRTCMNMRDDTSLPSLCEGNCTMDTCFVQPKDSSRCSIECTTLTNCSSCTQSSGCSWCLETQKCLNTYNSPTQCLYDCSPQCTLSGASSCPATSCESQSSCSTCLSQSSCLWCPVTNQCQTKPPGGLCGGPCVANDGITSCLRDSISQCAAKGHRCSDFDSCSTCTTQGGNACVWCTESAQCIEVASKSGGPAFCTNHSVNLFAVQSTVYTVLLSMNQIQQQQRCSGCLVSRPEKCASPDHCCYQNDTACSGHGTCDTVCQCHPSRAGDKCERCGLDYFGPSCSICPGVDDYGACHAHGHCNGAGTFDGTGKCECTDGWKGNECENCNTTSDPHWQPDCKNCAPKYYGLLCQDECSCEIGDCHDGRTGDGQCLCRAHGYSCTDDNHGRCDNTTGRCTCLAAGFFGEQCERSGQGEAILTAAVFTPALIIFVVVATCKSRRGLTDHVQEYQQKMANVGDSLGMNFSNFFEILILLVEMLQLCALSFKKFIPWSSEASSVQSFTLPLLFEFDKATEFFLISVITASCVIMFTLILMTFYCQCGGVQLYERLQQSRCGSLLLLPAPTFLMLVSLAWLPLTSVMFRGLNCTYLTSGGLRPYLDADPSIQCWTSSHTLYIIMSIIGLFIFVPLLLDMKPKLMLMLAKEQQQILYHPHFTLVQLVMELATLAATTFLSKYTLIHIMVTFCICVVLAIFVYSKQPCMFAAVNTWHMTFYIISAWCALGGLIASLVDDRSIRAPFYIWLIGIIVMVAYIVFMKLGWLPTADGMAHALLLKKVPPPASPAASTLSPTPSPSVPTPSSFGMVPTSNLHTPLLYHTDDDNNNGKRHQQGPSPSAPSLSHSSSKGSFSSEAATHGSRGSSNNSGNNPAMVIHV